MRRRRKRRIRKRETITNRNLSNKQKKNVLHKTNKDKEINPGKC